MRQIRIQHMKIILEPPHNNFYAIAMHYSGSHKFK